MRILYAFADFENEWNTSEWRCAIPARAINEVLAPIHEAKMVSVQNLGRNEPEAITMATDSNVLVIERLALGALIPLIEELKYSGKTVIVDLDDAYSMMPKTVRAYPFWHEGRMKVKDQTGNTKEIHMQTLPIEQLKWSVKLCSALTSPSTQILDDWKDFNATRIQIPNYPDTSKYLRFHHDSWTPKKQITIGWGGSITHLDSWTQTQIVGALERIFQDNPQVKLAIAGGDTRVFDLFKQYKARLLTYKWVPPTEWPMILNTFDIGLIPLAPKYDYRRSWVKSLEYTLMGIPWIGTKCPATSELEPYGTTVVNSSAAWRRAIQKAIDDYGTHKEKVDSGFQFACEQDIKANVLKIIETYGKIGSTTKV